MLWVFWFFYDGLLIVGFKVILEWMNIILNGGRVCRVLCYCFNKWELIVVYEEKLFIIIYYIILFLFYVFDWFFGWFLEMNWFFNFSCIFICVGRMWEVVYRVEEVKIWILLWRLVGVGL